LVVSSDKANCDNSKRTHDLFSWDVLLKNLLI
jgi:hypothetical protein